jgi:hypothetical protein
MPVFYTDSGSFNFLEITSSLVISSSAVVNLGSNTSIFSGSFSGSFIGNGVNLTNIIVPSFKTTTDSPTITGTVANTLVTQSLIPANTFTTGNVVEVKARFIKTGVAGAPTFRIYVNSTNSLSGATLAATFGAAATVLFVQFSRLFVIRGSANTEVFSSTFSAGSDDTSSPGAPATTITNDWTTNQYVLFAVQPGNTGDSAKCSFYKIFPL